MHADLIIDAAGWLGATALLVSYGLLSARRVSGTSTAYQLLNLAGSGGLIVNTLYYGALPSAVVNVVWSGIAVYTLATAPDQARRGQEEPLEPAR